MIHPDVWFADLLQHDSRKGVREDEATCVARLMEPDGAGEYRYFLAPSDDERWFAWADWHVAEPVPGRSHALVTQERAGDSGYDFENGGAFFPSREAALRAIYAHVAGEAAAWAKGRGSAEDA